MEAPGNYTITTRALSLHPDSSITIRDYPPTSTLAINDASASGQSFDIQVTRQVAGQVQQLSEFTVTPPPGRILDLLYGQVQNGLPPVQLG